MLAMRAAARGPWADRCRRWVRQWSAIRAAENSRSRTQGLRQGAVQAAARTVSTTATGLRYHRRPPCVSSDPRISPAMASP